MFIPTKENIKQLLDNSEGLADDAKDWVELRLQLLKVDAEVQVNGIIRKIMLAILGLIILFFASITLALGIGLWLGNAFWGFLSVTIFLLIVTIFINWYKPAFFKLKSEKIEKTAQKLLNPGKK